MNINPNIFRAYDIRGVYEKDLTAEVANLIGKGFGTYLGGGKTVVVGRDNRIHGEELQRAFIEGLVSTGCHVTNVGLSPSPYVYFANTIKNFDAGCNVSASHNPAEYNGFKLIAKQAHSVCGKELQIIREIIEKGDFIEGEGSVEENTYVDEYLEKLESMFTFPRKLKVVVDTGNGIAGNMYPRIIKSFGHEVVELYTELDGTFPNHQPDPIVEKNLVDLQQKVKETGADMGIAFDGDGDRAGFVDADGIFYNSDKTLLLLARDVLSRHSGAKIVFTVSNSQVLFSDIKKHGGTPIMCEVGHSFVENTMTRESAILGGEQSGHFFIKENYYPYDDALVTALKMMEILSKTNATFADLFSDIPQTYTEEEMRPYVDDDKKFEIIESIKDYFTEKYDCITMDGVRIDFGDDAWAGIRASNTSPCISICLEAKSKEKLAHIKSEVLKHLEGYEEIQWDKH